MLMVEYACGTKGLRPRLDKSGLARLGILVKVSGRLRVLSASVAVAND